MTQQEFQHKYLPLAPQFYRRALALLGNAQDAEDAVQDTYLKLWNQSTRLERMELPEAFMQTVLRNVCLNMLRKRHTPENELDMADKLPEEGDDIGRVEQQGTLRMLLDSLSPKARRMVTLRHLGDFSYEEMATLTGETEGNIRTILSRARRFLKERYRDLTK
jgi:RNA polymerase sigma factor, sigma-70 family